MAYPDVKSDYWGKPYIDKVTRMGKMVGKTVKGVFGFYPEATFTRAEVATILSRTPMTWGEVFEYAAPAVVYIAGQLGDHGSGFLISDTGYIVTAAHVVGERNYINIRFYDGRVDTADVVAMHPSADLMILRLRQYRNDLPYLDIDDAVKVRKCDHILAVGHPGTAEWDSSWGYVDKTKVGNADYEFHVTTPFSSGISGGPVLNQTGEVLGIAIRNAGDCTNLVYFRDWLKKYIV